VDEQTVVRPDPAHLVAASVAVDVEIRGAGRHGSEIGETIPIEVEYDWAEAAKVEAAGVEAAGVEAARVAARVETVAKAVEGKVEPVPEEIEGSRVFPERCLAFFERVEREIVRVCETDQLP